MSTTLSGPAGPSPRQSRDAERDHERDYQAVAERLERRAVPGARAEDIVEAVRRFAVAVPSWALVTGGTRFGRFPGPGEPRTLAERLEDAAVVHRLTGAAPRLRGVRQIGRAHV